MRIFFVYLFLEYKKSVRVLLKSAGSLLLMLCLIMGGAVAAGVLFFGAQMFQAIDVGVAIPEEETQTKAVARFLSAMDSVESICNFEYLSQAEAMEKLYEGEIQAVIVLPESLYDDMYNGQKGKISVYLPKQAPFQVQVFQELLSDGVSLLQTAEAGVLAARDMAESGYSKMKPNKAAESISYTYIECALNREKLFDKNVYSPLGQMNLYQYYFAAAVSPAYGRAELQLFISKEEQGSRTKAAAPGPGCRKSISDQDFGHGEFVLDIRNHSLFVGMPVFKMAEILFYMVSQRDPAVAGSGQYRNCRLFPHRIFRLWEGNAGSRIPAFGKCIDDPMRRCGDTFGISSRASRKNRTVSAAGFPASILYRNVFWKPE